jgi:hypothetical protein
MILNDIDETITFDSLEECIEIKNKLIAFIKQNKREVNDKGNEPNLTFTTKLTNNGNND